MKPSHVAGTVSQIEIGVALLFPKRNLAKFIHPVKNVTVIFSCLFENSLVENETKCDEDPIVFLTNTMEIP